MATQRTLDGMERIEAILLYNEENGEFTIVGNDRMSYEDIEAAWRTWITTG